MLLANAETQWLGEPICVLTFQGLLEALVVQGLPGNGLKGVVFHVVSLAPFNLQLFQGVAEVVTRKVRSLDGKAAVVGDPALVVGEGLGFYYDDAVGALGAVNCLGRSVLKDGDALDTVHVHIGHLLQGGLEAVEDEQRLVGLGEEVALEVGGLGCKRGGAADLHGRHCVGVGTGLQVVQDKERRVEVLQRLHHIAVGYPFYIFAGHGLHRPGETVFFAGENTGHNGFFQNLGVGLQEYLEFFLYVCDFNFLGYVAHHLGS